MEYVTLSQLAATLNLNKSNVRKYALKHGFSFLRVRVPSTGNQKCLALSVEDAEALKDVRQKDGFASVIKLVSDDGRGVFYVVQLVPELSALRVKLGFTTAIDARLQSFHTSCPNAKILKMWPCKKTWEIASIDSITRIGCTPISNEVFLCDNINKMLSRGDAFFAMMPSI